MDNTETLNWSLARGAHRDPAKGTCVAEAALIAAGLEYRRVKDVNNLPPCFSRVISSFVIRLNDSMTVHVRNRLLPYVLRLAGSADAPEFEYERAKYMLDALFHTFMPRLMRMVGIEDAAAIYEGGKIQDLAALQRLTTRVLQVVGQVRRHRDELGRTDKILMDYATNLPKRLNRAATFILPSSAGFHNIECCATGADIVASTMWSTACAAMVLAETKRGPESDVLDIWLKAIDVLDGALAIGKHAQIAPDVAQKRLDAVKSAA